MRLPFSIVLLRPEIPHNTGAVGRLCVGLGVKLNLVRPLGFRLDDKSVARAGLDYWPHLEKAIHDTWEDYLASERPRRLFFLSTRGMRSLYDCSFEPGDALAFGNEGHGLPAGGPRVIGGVRVVEQVIRLPSSPSAGVRTSAAASDSSLHPRHR